MSAITKYNTFNENKSNDINNAKPKMAKEILRDHYKNNASICNKIVCGDCEEPSCFLSNVNTTCNDCCCCLPDNHYVAPIHIGGSSGGNDCGGGGDCVAVVCCAAAACLAACALYSCGKACNQQRIISNYCENFSAPSNQSMK